MSASLSVFEAEGTKPPKKKKICWSIQNREHKLDLGRQRVMSGIVLLDKNATKFWEQTKNHLVQM